MTFDDPPECNSRFKPFREHHLPEPPKKQISDTLNELTELRRKKDRNVISGP